MASRAHKVKIMLLAPIMVALAACSTMSGSKKSVDDADFLAQSYKAADMLAESMPAGVQARGPVLYSVFVDIEDAHSTTRFGQMMAEHVSSRMSQLGFEMKEARLRTGIGFSDKGEFMLSRDAQKVIREHDAWAALVGTYAPAEDMVLMNLRVIDLTSGSIAATYDVNLPLGDNTRNLLGMEKESTAAYRGSAFE